MATYNVSRITAVITIVSNICDKLRTHETNNNTDSPKPLNEETLLIQKWVLFQQSFNPEWSRSFRWISRLGRAYQRHAMANKRHLWFFFTYNSTLKMRNVEQLRYLCTRCAIQSGSIYVQYGVLYKAVLASTPAARRWTSWTSSSATAAMSKPYLL